MGKLPQLSHNQIRELQTIINSSDGKGPEVRRAQAILLVNQSGTAATCKAMTGYGRRHTFLLRKRYLTEGAVAIQDRREGQPKELLTKRQREVIIETVKTKPPKECVRGSDHEYWTTGLLGRYIKDTYKVAYKSRTSPYLLFRKAIFTYHKPGMVSERHNEQEVQEWRNKAMERVKEAWSEPDTVLLTEDEMHLSNQTTTQKVWLPQGEYPKIEVARKREARSIYGFLNIKTGTEHAFKTPRQTMYITARILKKIRKIYPTQNILLFWDQAGWHRGSEAQKVIKADATIETMYFPTAAPEENPQEHVWKAGRSQTSHNAFMQDIDVTTHKFVKYLNTTPFPYSLLGFSAIS